MKQEKRKTRFFVWFIFALFLIIIFKSLDNFSNIFDWLRGFISILMPFIVGVPSALRYWLREQKTQQSKVLFAIVVYSTLVVISFLSVALHLINLWLLIIPILLFIYGTIILLWLLCKEIPKYEEEQYVPYDSIWFEGQATALGDKYF